MNVRLHGARYHVETAGTGPALLLLHGFMGSAASWQRWWADWSQRFHLVAVDLLGHGETDVPDSSERTDMDQVVEDLVGLADHLELEQMSVLGYSMGGRVALALAVRHPERVDRMVLVSTSPGLEQAGERAARRAHDAGLADKLLSQGLESFVDDWEALPLFRTQQRLDPVERSAIRHSRLHNDARGLAMSLRGLGTGQQPSFWPNVADLRMPILFMAGAEDSKFTEIASLMAQRLPSSRLAIVEGAGHAVHLEQPQVFDRIVVEFLVDRPSHS